MYIQITTPKLSVWRIENEFSNVPHSHADQFQITVPIFGTCHFTHENKSIELAPGEALVQHPQDNHSFHIGAGAGVVIFLLDRDNIERLTGQRALEFAFRQSFDPEETQGVFRKLASALSESDRFDDSVVEEAESRVLYYLYRKLEGSHQAGLAAAWGQPSASDKHIARALEYMQAHFRQQISVDTLAALALQSRYHFIRSFKQLIGLTPYQYLLRLRIEHAQQLLRNTRLTVTEISFGLGFSSTSQFYRAFFKTVGETPERYRSRP